MRIVRRVLVSVAICLLVSRAVQAGLDTRPTTQPAHDHKDELRARLSPAIDKAMRFLAQSQNEDGGWEGYFGGSDPAITSLVAKTFIQHPDYGEDHPIVRRAMKFVLAHAQDDGGIYDPKVGYRNYTTSVVLMALSSTRDPACRKHIEPAQRFLKGLQWTEDTCDNDGNDITPDHPWYGGAGYGRNRRPDLSNTQMMLEALHQSGLPADDPTYEKAMAFVVRCQMLDRYNDQPFANGSNDGGFIYTPANGGESNAGTIESEDGRTHLRSYGSMTYAGFKSLLYARVDRDDPRIKAAWNWISRHYTLTSNPNMPGRQSEEGLFYYYHVFAKALSAWGEPFVVDDQGKRHDWRRDLGEQLLSVQKPEGYWVNEADRWQEGNPHLVTAYSVLAMQEAMK